MSTSSHTFVRCRACGHRVYKDLRRCPHCSHLMRMNLQPLSAWVIAVLVSALISFALVQWLTVDDMPRPAPTLDRP